MLLNRINNETNSTNRLKIQLTLIAPRFHLSSMGVTYLPTQFSSTFTGLRNEANLVKWATTFEKACCIDVIHIIWKRQRVEE